MTNSVAVIGGGIAGIQAALDLAEAGCQVVLVERAPSLGGKMAGLDKNFPTLDCSICIEAPKISDVVRHPNIEVLTLADVVGLEGEAGDFTLTVDQRGRFVTDACTRCDLCAAACPQTRPNEFDQGLAARKAIYTPFAQAEPGAYVIDMDACLNDPPNYMPCTRCTDACLPKAIDFTKPRVARLTRNVAAVLVATGVDLFDPRQMPEYGYGTHPDILTSMEFERLLNAAGPTEGEILRPSDGHHPEKLLFVLCVGSRDERFCHYCSRVCCMYSMKEAFQARDHGVHDVTVLYMDLRAYGKGFDGFLDRTRQEGVKFVRGRPGRIEGKDGSIRVRFEDTASGKLQEDTFDMVVLAPALLPSRGNEGLAKVLGLDLDSDGFVKASSGDGKVLETTRTGVYACGAAAGPKDIPDSVAEASGAAAAALRHVSKRAWPEEAHVEPIDTSGPPKVGVFLCDCGSNIAGTIRVPDLVKAAQGMPGVGHAEEVMFACAANTQASIVRTLKEKGLNRCVVGACSPKTHGTTFQNVCSRAGLNPYLFEMANLRNQASWVHRGDKDGATKKGLDLLQMAVAKAQRLAPLATSEEPVVQRTLVIGGGVAGLSAAAALARQGFETHLVEQRDRLGGLVRDLGDRAGNGSPAARTADAKASEAVASGVRVHLGTEVRTLSGHIGNFHAGLSDGAALDVGAVVVASGAVPFETHALRHGEKRDVLTNLELEGRIDEFHGRRITFVGCVGARREGQGCSRYCCQSMFQQALKLAQAGNEVRILSPDVRTYDRHSEELYAAAGRAGVLFFRLPATGPAEDQVTWDDRSVVFDDVLSGKRIELPTDVLVLTVGLRPAAPNAAVEQLKLSQGEDGFLLESHPKLAPVEAAVAGVYLAGSCQGPKTADESAAQGLAAAAKAGKLLARGKIEQEPLKARIDPEKCTGCTVCAKVCPHNAIESKVKEPHKVIEAACMGCGTCASSCPQDAITMPGFTDDQVISQIDAATADHPQDKVVVFACNWCSYAGADQAGIAKLQYPPSSRIIKTMCSGRVSEKFVFRALERGAGAVLVSGCHPGSCHYLTANLETAKRVTRWKKKMEAKGYAPERLELEWISAAEGKRFAEKMRTMHERIGKPALLELKVPAKGRDTK